MATDVGIAADGTSFTSACSPHPSSGEPGESAWEMLERRAPDHSGESPPRIRGSAPSRHARFHEPRERPLEPVSVPDHLAFVHGFLRQ